MPFQNLLVFFCFIAGWTALLFKFLSVRKEKCKYYISLSERKLNTFLDIKFKELKKPTKKNAPYVLSLYFKNVHSEILGSDVQYSDLFPGEIEFILKEFKIIFEKKINYLNRCSIEGDVDSENLKKYPYCYFCFRFRDYLLGIIHGEVIMTED